MVTQNYTISTVKVATPPKVKMSQYDYGMRTITFAVVDGSGSAVDLTGKTVTVEGTRIDGHAFAEPCTVSNDTATFVDTVDMTNAAGDHPAELVVRQNDERLGTMNFIISVEPAAMDEGADVSPEDKNLFEQLYAKVVSGSPVAVDTVAEMTNTDGVYLYTGNETGYTKGYWYYYDGSAWVAGGAYGSGATDKTLTLSDVAADAKVVGDRLDYITDYVLESYITDLADGWGSVGLTFSKVSDTQVAIYGTATATRRFNICNGKHIVMSTSSAFNEILPAGKYRFSVNSDATLAANAVRLQVTTNTYASGVVATVSIGDPQIFDCDSPIMFGLFIQSGTNLGTEDDPTIVTLRVESITAKDEVARETKADKDGTYPDLTAGQLYTDEGVENVEPYFFRAVPAAASEARMRKLVGGTVAWNQLIPPDIMQTTTKNGITVTNNGDGSWTVNGTSTAYTNFGSFATLTPTYVTGHKMLYLTDNFGYEEWGLVPNGSNVPSMYRSYGMIIDYGSNPVLVVLNGVTVTNQVIHPMVIDLTLALGSTIADYIYSLETATAGAGVAFFRKYFPEAYYPYNAGELKSVGGVSEKVTTGKNLLTGTLINGQIGSNGGFSSSPSRITNVLADSTTKISETFLKAGTYTLSVEGLNNCTAMTKDENGNILDNFALSWHNLPYTFTTTTDGYFIFTARLSSYADISPSDYSAQVELGSTATDYEPYVSHTYPLDSTLTLRGIPKLADGKMYFDGDEYKADGTVVRKYGIVDLGTLTWSYDSSVPRFYSTGINSLAKRPTATNIAANMVSGKYVNTDFASLYQTVKANGTMALGDTGTLNVIDTAYSTHAAFKAAMSGVYLVYELATPTTETADPFTESQKVDPYGTEEFVSTGIVPIGHDTLYVDDLRQRLEDIAPPTTDGTYTLQVTVSGGKPTFSWVAANRSLSMGNPFASAAEEATEETEEQTEEETEEPVEEEVNER